MNIKNCFFAVGSLLLLLSPAVKAQISDIPGFLTRKNNKMNGLVHPEWSPEQIKELLQLFVEKHPVIVGIREQVDHEQLYVSGFALLQFLRTIASSSRTITFKDIKAQISSGKIYKTDSQFTQGEKWIIFIDDASFSNGAQEIEKIKLKDVEILPISRAEKNLELKGVGFSHLLVNGTHVIDPMDSIGEYTKGRLKIEILPSETFRDLQEGERKHAVLRIEQLLMALRYRIQHPWLGVSKIIWSKMARATIDDDRKLLEMSREDASVAIDRIQMNLNLLYKEVATLRTDTLLSFVQIIKGLNIIEFLHQYHLRIFGLPMIGVGDWKYGEQQSRQNQREGMRSALHAFVDENKLSVSEALMVNDILGITQWQTQGSNIIGKSEFIDQLCMWVKTQGDFNSLFREGLLGRHEERLKLFQRRTVREAFFRVFSFEIQSINYGASQWGWDEGTIEIYLRDGVNHLVKGIVKSKSIPSEGEERPIDYKPLVAQVMGSVGKAPKDETLNVFLPRGESKDSPCSREVFSRWP